MVKYYVATLSLLAGLQASLEDRRDDETGAGAIEYAVIAVVGLGVAIAVGVAVKAVVSKYTGQLK